MKEPLVTERLQLLPVESNNFDIIFSMLRNEKVKKYLCDNRDLDKEAIRQLIRDSDALFAEEGIGLWLIYPKDERSAIGFCGFSRNEILELIYVVHPYFQNQGIGTEATFGIVNYFCQNHGEDLYAKVDLPNVESHKVARKLGMREVATEKNEVTGFDMKVYKLVIPQ